MTRPHLPPLFEARPSSWLDKLLVAVKPKPPTPERDARAEARRFAEPPEPITGWVSL